MRRILTAVIGAALLGGCATSATPLSEARPVPKDRMRSAPPVTSAEPATCVFIRDRGFVGSGSAAEISLDERPVATLYPGEVARVSIDPGDRLFGVLLDDPFGLHNPVVVAQNVRPGGDCTYRVSLNGDGTVNLQRRSLSESGNLRP